MSSCFLSNFLINLALVIISYLKERGNNSSYRGSLRKFHGVIIALTSSNNRKKLNNTWLTQFLNNWKKLNNIWFIHFLDEGEKLFDKDVFNKLKNKVRFYFAKMGNS